MVACPGEWRVYYWIGKGGSGRGFDDGGSIEVVDTADTQDFTIPIKGDPTTFSRDD